ncbi:MAG: YggT family protein [bacterium]
MSPNPSGAFLFLFDTLINLASMVFLLRFLLQLSKADYYNPVTQMILKISSPIIRPVRKIIPNPNRVDYGSLLILLLLSMASTALLVMASPNHYSLFAIAFHALTLVISKIIWAYLIVIIVRAIASFFMPPFGNPYIDLLVQISEPLLAPVRKILPDLGGLDFSPLVVIIGLQFLLKFLGL